MSEMQTFEVGDLVEVQMPDGWKPGIVTGLLAAGVIGKEERFQRLAVRLDDHPRRVWGIHPDCVRHLQAVTA